MPRWAQALIVGAATFSAVSDVIAEVGRDDAATMAETSAGTALALVLMANAALALMAFRVSIGAAILAGVMLISMFSPVGSGIGLLGMAVSGIVVAKADRRFAACYVVFCALWLAGSFALHEDLRETGFVVGGLLLVSAAIGAAYAALAERNRAAAVRISGFEEEREESIKGERSRIARELHDIVAHHITMASMHASVVSMAQDPEQRDKSLKVIAGSTRQALTELRWMLHVLQNDDDEESADGESARDLRLGATLGSIRQNLEALGFATAVDYDPKTLAGLPVETDLALGRILQEAATNVVKHGDRAQKVRISIGQTATSVHLVVRNGVAKAGPSAIPSSGMGLENMRTRASQRGGQVDAGGDGEVWIVRCELPLR